MVKILGLAESQNGYLMIKDYYLQQKMAKLEENGFKSLNMLLDIINKLILTLQLLTIFKIKYNFL